MTHAQVLQTIARAGELTTLADNAHDLDAVAFIGRAFANQLGVAEDDGARAAAHAALIIRNEDGQGAHRQLLCLAARDMAVALDDGFRICPALRQAAAMNPHLSRRDFSIAALLVGLDPQTARIQWGKIDRAFWENH
jgi:hypothetical protein